jgi:hypothetical protein
MKLVGEPDAENPHVRFEQRKSAKAPCTTGKPSKRVRRIDPMWAGIMQPTASVSVHDHWPERQLKPRLCRAKNAPTAA